MNIPLVDKVIKIIGFMLLTAMMFFFPAKITFAAEPQLIYTHGEFMDEETIYPAEWLGIIFSQPLKNDTGQATKIIQKAVNSSLGYGNATVETTDNASFVIIAISKTNIKDKKIVIPTKSIKDATTGMALQSSLSIPFKNDNNVIETNTYSYDTAKSKKTSESDNTKKTSEDPLKPQVAVVTTMAPVTSTPGYPGQLIYYGSTGEEVKQIQIKLNEKDFKSGPNDGIFGPITKGAVKRFQKAKGLDVDGIVGPITWPALFGFTYFYKKLKPPAK